MIRIFRIRTARIAIGLVAGPLLFGGCASAPRFVRSTPIPRPAAHHETAPVDVSQYRETGEASFYGREFNGRPTASGERFDMYALSAAHRTLPFGTRVRVTNLANGKIVIVRINDRGPHKRQRIIDLSYGAARRIGISGTARVALEALK